MTFLFYLSLNRVSIKKNPKQNYCRKRKKDAQSYNNIKNLNPGLETHFFVQLCGADGGFLLGEGVSCGLAIDTDLVLSNVDVSSSYICFV